MSLTNTLPSASEAPTATVTATAATTGTRLDRGLQVLGRIELALGNPHGLLHGMRVHAPRFKQHTIEQFGDRFADDQRLEVRNKLLVALALSATQPGHDDLLEFHIGAALKAGWDREQIIETFELVGAYAGQPAALRAVKVAIATFEKVDA
jgi:4-carboxymuconolactone decarboxylase